MRGGSLVGTKEQHLYFNNFSSRKSFLITFFVETWVKFKKIYFKFILSQVIKIQYPKQCFMWRTMSAKI